MTEKFDLGRGCERNTNGISILTTFVQDFASVFGVQSSPDL
jgi:hypothetical protein